MKLPGPAMFWWAGRAILKSPWRSLHLAASVFAVTVVIAVPLLLSNALSETAERLLDAGPSLVLRRLNAGGWAGLPARESERRARAVPGVTRARARIWGVARAADLAVTVLGVSGSEASPRPGQAVVGPALRAHRGGALKLVGRTSQTFAVVDVLSDAASMVAHDLVLLHEDDARKVLGLAPGQASDLAIDVFHEQEEQAILPDLAQAFDFQVQITPRSRTAGRIASELGRFGSLSVLASVPSLLALALLVSFLAVEARHSRRDVGRLKALGWSSSEIVAHHAIRTALLGVPIAIAGLFCAALVVFWPGVTWPGRWFFDWQGHAPELTLVSSDATLVLLGVAALVLAPFTAATLIPVALGASSSPADLLDTGSR